MSTTFPGLEHLPPLRGRQALWLRAYVMHWDATKAARAAGYAESGVRVRGCELKKKLKDHIEAACSAAFQQAQEENPYQEAEQPQNTVTDPLDPDNNDVTKLPRILTVREVLIAASQMAQDEEDSRLRAKGVELLMKHYGLLSDSHQGFQEDDEEAKRKKMSPEEKREALKEFLESGSA